MVGALDSTGLFNGPMANITPFTYRDGETYLEQLKRLREYVLNLNSQVNSQLAAISLADQNAITALTSQFNDLLAQFSAKQLEELFDIENQDPTFVFDPTTGNPTTVINTVISHVYDNLRYYAYFADQLDTFGYTAAEWDSIGYTARQFDLSLGYAPNVNQAVDIIPPAVAPIN